MMVKLHGGPGDGETVNVCMEEKYYRWYLEGGHWSVYRLERHEGQWRYVYLDTEWNVDG